MAWLSFIDLDKTVVREMKCLETAQISHRTILEIRGLTWLSPWAKSLVRTAVLSGNLPFPAARARPGSSAHSLASSKPLPLRH